MKISRRGFVAGSALSVASAAAGVATGATLSQQNTEAALALRLNPYGRHQAGIEAELNSTAQFIAFTIRSQTDRAAMNRWMALISDDIARLANGEGVLADPQPELAIAPARFSCAIGFGLSLFDKLDLNHRLPKSISPIPSFKIDQLSDDFSDGDVLFQIQADDPLVLNHATRALLRDSADFADVRYVMQGFSNAKANGEQRISQRNLMGQVDGTDNPILGSQNFADRVWITDGPEWLVGGTQLVLRRIKMNLHTWDTLSHEQKELAIGRNLKNGAPLTGQNETDAPDLEAENSNGLKVIPEYAHIRRASSQNLEEQFFRRPYNYQGEINEFGEQEAGLLWTAFAKDLAKQYVPVQQRLADFDLLNLWTTPVGSSMWLFPHGFTADRHLAKDLFA